MVPGLISAATDLAGDLVRNIKGIRVSQDLFDDLAEEPADVAVAIAAEAATRIPSAASLITRPFDYGTVITYPFMRENWHQTRFSDGLGYGVWYGSLQMATTVFETVFHWHRFVTDSFPAEDRVVRSERRVFAVRGDAILIDLRGKESAFPGLVSRADYRFTHDLGRYLERKEQRGLLVRSARCDGINAAIFRASALSSPRDLCALTYAMNPTEDRVVVERTPGRAWLRIAPSALY
ncbi:MAG TPA: RES family NAD+ phosphorylase [Candidatus Binatia bacterium]|nr:RES family NAD+ phosphorylase [Candidatus Binatia bacterium]